METPFRAPPANPGLDAQIEALAAHIAAYPTATEALANWCASRRPGPTEIHAHILTDRPMDPQHYTGPLQITPGEPVRHRRVQLLWGETIVSEAQNWYLPGRLPDATARSLLTTTIPFGAAIRPLAPRRHTTLITPVHDGSAILHIQATVTIPHRGTIAEVHEHYRRSLID